MDTEKMGFQITRLPQNVTKRPKLLKAAVIGVVVFAVVAATTIVAIYVGGKMTKDAYQDAWNTVQDHEGRYMEERINKTKDMMEIDVPNSVQIIYDYKNNIAVFRYIHVDTRIRSPCYVREIDPEFDPKPLGDNTQLEGPKPNEFSSTSRKWKFTDSEVPSYMTSSSRVQDMCSGTQIYWMEVVADTHIEKREVPPGGSQETLLILPITIFGITCRITVFLDKDAFGIPVGISFSPLDCTAMTSSSIAPTSSSSTMTSSSIVTTSLSVTMTSSSIATTLSSSTMTSSSIAPTCSFCNMISSSIATTSSSATMTSSSIETTSSSSTMTSSSIATTSSSSTMTSSSIATTSSMTATTATISPTTSSPTASSTEPPC